MTPPVTLGKQVFCPGLPLEKGAPHWTIDQRRTLWRPQYSRWCATVPTWHSQYHITLQGRWGFSKNPLLQFFMAYLSDVEHGTKIQLPLEKILNPDPTDDTIIGGQHVPKGTQIYNYSGGRPPHQIHFWGPPSIPPWAVFGWSGDQFRRKNCLENCLEIQFWFCDMCKLLTFPHFPSVKGGWGGWPTGNG